MSEYLEYGGLEEDAKELRKKVYDFFKTDYDVLYGALRDVYEQGVFDAREQIVKELESAVIEVAGNSAATMDQAIRIARGKNE